MFPAAEDNCAVLCLPCVPNILVIATETGTLYHCAVLEAEEEETGAVERWMRGWEVVPSLYVFECVELELTLKLVAGDDEAPVESDFTCPIRLHSGLLVEGSTTTIKAPDINMTSLTRLRFCLALLSHKYQLGTVVIDCQRGSKCCFLKM
ncbi:unnamed protein product [Oncorhynchus mykiss]|uniref:Uncharacterized protein n=1 Tax=Oncorhynchus mykiss TaxID=8022 RepID=A0A060YAT4_ONCMY|nr:unnamed protein product [Oncorhynchus mykiss]